MLPRLAHGWHLIDPPNTHDETVREFIRPAIRAVPPLMARRLGSCRIWLPSEVDSSASSRWTESELGFDVLVASMDRAGHDIAMELLWCLGQALWGRLTSSELRAYWALLDREIEEGVTGEIDEEALEEKRLLLGGRAEGTNLEQLERYGFFSFAGTAAEYVHCLWHDVTVRAGPDHLAATQMRRRLTLLARWFPAVRGRRLFAKQKSTRPANSV